MELLPQAGEASPRFCAGTALRGLVTQPDMPPRDQVYRVPLDETRFLVL